MLLGESIVHDDDDYNARRYLKRTHARARAPRYGSKSISAPSCLARVCVVCMWSDIARDADRKVLAHATRCGRATAGKLQKKRSLPIDPRSRDAKRPFDRHSALHLIHRRTHQPRKPPVVPRGHNHIEHTRFSTSLYMRREAALSTNAPVG